MFENTVHFQTNLETYPSPGLGSALGAPQEAAPGVCFQNMFANSPYFMEIVDMIITNKKMPGRNSLSVTIFLQWPD